jgi:hypothetical protein
LRLHTFDIISNIDGIIAQKIYLSIDDFKKNLKIWSLKTTESSFFCPPAEEPRGLENPRSLFPIEDASRLL